MSGPFIRVVREMRDDRQAHLAASVTEPAPFNAWTAPSSRPVTYPQCKNGPCHGGRLCPSPRECAEGAPINAPRIVVGLICAVVAIIAGALLFGLR